MTVRHHPRDETLMEFAAGALAPALSALVSCHVTLCPRCRVEVAQMERIGGALLERLDDGEFVRNRAEQVLARIAVPAQAGGDGRGGRSSEKPDLLPRPLVRYLGMRMGDVPWKRLAPGIEQFKIKLPKRGGDLRLLRVQPGLKLLRHGHYGTELTMVLKGSYADETGEYHAGEVADLDEDIEHRPRATGEIECICIIAGETHPRYKSLSIRLLRPILGF